MPDWEQDAVAAGFDLDELTLVADFVASGVLSIDGAPFEVLPGYWVIPGFLPYDGHVILATVDGRPTRDSVSTPAVRRNMFRMNTIQTAVMITVSFASLRASQHQYGASPCSGPNLTP